MSTFRLNENTITKQDEPEVTKLRENETGVEQSAAAENPNAIKEIILKAPLGHAYTQALNLLLSKDTNHTRELRQESVYQALQANILADEAEGNPETPHADKAFVYVYDGKRMGMGDLGRMHDEVSLKKEKTPEAGYVCVVIDNAQQVLDQPSLGKPFEATILSLESMQIKCFYSTDQGINGITSFLKG